MIVKINGVSFIEVLVSLTLISLIIFGLISFQLVTLRQSKALYYTSIAQSQLTNLSERLNTFEEKDWEMAISQWNKQNHLILPQGEGVVMRQQSKIIAMVSWGGMPSAQCEESKLSMVGCLRISL